eukprot:1955655-Prymnesium_polylepis.1
MDGNRCTGRARAYSAGGRAACLVASVVVLFVVAVSRDRLVIHVTLLAKLRLGRLLLLNPLLVLDPLLLGPLRSDERRGRERPRRNSPCPSPAPPRRPAPCTPAAASFT